MSDQALETVQSLPSLPRIGDPAPQFEAVTTHGPIKLEDYKGSWLVLFSHPADLCRCAQLSLSPSSKFIPN